MRAFQTTVLERKTAVQAGFATEPYETGWASEAIYFVEVHEQSGAALTARVQVSPDGIRWVDEGAAHVELPSSGLAYVRVAHFGGWLRLVLAAADADNAADANARVTIHLVLKE